MDQKTGILPVFKREWERIASSRICLWGIFSASILVMLVLIPMMDTGLPQKIPIAVVDLDNTSTTRALIRQLDAFPKTNIKLKSLSFRDARQRMEKMEVYAVLTIPKDFTKDALSGNQPNLVYYTNNAFLISGSLLFQDLKTMSTLASAAVGLKTAEAQGYTVGQIMPILQPISVETHPLGNPGLNYSVYLNNTFLPGILQLIIFLFTVSCLGSEVKAGSGPEAVRLSGNSSFKLMVGKLLPYTIIFLMISLMYISVLYYYNGFPLRSGFWPMFFNYFFLILASQGFGVMLFFVFKNYRFTLSAASLIGTLSFSLIGFSFPTLAIDPMLQAVSYLLPLRYFFLIYTDQALNGYAIGYSMYYYAALLAFAFMGLLFFGKMKKILLYDVYEP